MRTQPLDRKKRIGEVRGVVIDAVLLFDPPARLDPSHDSVTIGQGQSRVNRHIVECFAVGEKAAPLSSARMLARERNLLLTDHGAIVRTGIRSAVTPLKKG